MRQMKDFTGAIHPLATVDDEHNLTGEYQSTGLERMTMRIEGTIGFAFHRDDVAESTAAQRLGKFLDLMEAHMYSWRRPDILANAQSRWQMPQD
jgi:hypothetical protein